MRHGPSCLKYRLPSRRNLQIITQEIIRRHPDYQADWQKHVDPKWPVFAQMPGATSKWGIPLLFNPAGTDFAPDFIDQPSLIPSLGTQKGRGPILDNDQRPRSPVRRGDEWGFPGQDHALCAASTTDRCAGRSG